MYLYISTQYTAENIRWMREKREQTFYRIYDKFEQTRLSFVLNRLELEHYIQSDVYTPLNKHRPESE